MKFSCIALDLDKQGYKKQFEEANSACSVEVAFTTVKEFQKQVQENPYAFLLIATSDYSNELEIILSQFKQYCGAQTDKIYIICSNPSFKFKSNLFDYGISNLIASEAWVDAFTSKVNEQVIGLSDKSSSEYLCYVLYLYLRDANSKSIKKIAGMLEPFEAYDFFAAHHRSIALQAVSDYRGSFESNKKALELNPLYRPAMFEKLQNLIILNKPQKAYQEAEIMTEMGSNSLQIKIYFVYINADLFKFDAAKEQLNELRGLMTKAVELELQLYILFSEEKIETALDLIEKVPQIGPILFTKINSVGIKLSNEKKVLLHLQFTKRFTLM